MGESVECHHLDRALVALDVRDGFPRPRTPSFIELSHHIINLVIDLPIGRDVDAPGDGNLNEAHATTVLGLSLEQIVESPDAVGNALRVVKPLDSDADQLVGTQVQFTPPVLHGGVGSPASGLGVVSLEVDADGKGADQSTVATSVYLELVGINPRLDATVDRFDEVLTVVGYVEAKHVVAEQAVDELFVPGEGAEDLAVGPGNVPELGDDKSGIPLLQHSRKQGEMKVLDEDESRL